MIAETEMNICVLPAFWDNIIVKIILERIKRISKAEQIGLCSVSPRIDHVNTVYGVQISASPGLHRYREQIFGMHYVEKEFQSRWYLLAERHSIWWFATLN